MTDTEAFKVEQVLSIIETYLVTNSNTCELEFYKKLKVELTEKLKEYNG